jgi:hypothetical protein
MTFKTVTPYRNRERRVDFVSGVIKIGADPALKTVVKANVIPLTARATGEASLVPQRRFGDSGHKRTNQVAA